MSFSNSQVNLNADLPTAHVRRRHVGSNVQHCGSGGLVGLAHAMTPNNVGLGA